MPWKLLLWEGIFQVNTDKGLKTLQKEIVREKRESKLQDDKISKRVCGGGGLESIIKIDEYGNASQSLAYMKWQLTRS